MPKADRFAFLDVLRGFAVLWMIQVHITNVLLNPALRTTWYFDLLNISNGFVAPAFIFCAGAGLWIALDRKGASYLKRGRDLWMYLRRLGYILFWAYMLHVPFYSVERMLMGPTSDILPWLQVDVLQTIVYSSLVGLGVFLVVRDLRKASMIYGVLAISIMTFTVFVWNSNPFSWLPAPLALMITPANSPFSTLHSPFSTLHSPFPLLPWSCYLFAGAFATSFFMRHENKHLLAKRLLHISLSAILLVFAIKAIPFETPWTSVWWSSSPGMHIFRISGVVLAMSVLFLFEQRLRESKFGLAMQTIGNESLFLYISHLLLVYGQVATITKAVTGVDHTGYLGVAIMWVAITIPLLFIMNWWHTFKRNKPTLAQKFLVVQMCWMLLTLLLTPADFSLLELFGIAP